MEKAKTIFVVFLCCVVIIGIGKGIIYARHKIRLTELACLNAGGKFTVTKCWNCQEAYWAEKFGFNHLLGKTNAMTFEQAKAMAGDHIIYVKQHCISQ